MTIMGCDLMSIRELTSDPRGERKGASAVDQAPQCPAIQIGSLK